MDFYSNRAPNNPPSHERRERISLLGEYWKARSILGDDQYLTPAQLKLKSSGVTLAKRGRAGISQQHLRAMHEARSGWNRDEEPRYARDPSHMQERGEETILAEYMLLEGSDMDGGAFAGLRGPSASYDWFAGRAKSYMPHLAEDVLNRTDGLIMVIDERNEEIVHPLAVDVTTALDGKKGYRQKVRSDFERLTHSRRVGSEAYWYDVYADEPGQSFLEPKEGLIQTSLVTVYIPTGVCTLFNNPKTSDADADMLMASLGAFVRLQIDAELQRQLFDLSPRMKMFCEMALSSGRTCTDLRQELRSDLEELAQLLDDYAAELRPHDQAVRRICHILFAVWGAEADIERKNRAKKRPQIWPENFLNAIPPELSEWQQMIPTIFLPK